MSGISVIVPVYNAEQYLTNCIESILSQTFQDYELILIDDGSTDESGVICDEYARKNRQIKVIHQSNAGPSAARNRGLEESRGNYITFVDADDYVEMSYLEKLWQTLERYGADLVVGGMVVVREGKRSKRRKDMVAPELKMERMATREEAYRGMLEGKHALLFAWGKLYHRRLFQGLQYAEGEIYEDVKIICKLIERAERIVLTSYAGYFYIQRLGSITHEAMSHKHMILLENEKRLWTFMKDRYPKLESLAKRQYLNSCFFLIEKMASDPKFQGECRNLRKIILKNWKYLLFSTCVSWMERGGMICLLFGIPCYRETWKLFTKYFGYSEF